MKSVVGLRSLRRWRIPLDLGGNGPSRWSGLGTGGKNTGFCTTVRRYPALNARAKKKDSNEFSQDSPPANPLLDGQEGMKTWIRTCQSGGL